MTERKRLGLSLIIGHAIGVAVGFVVYFTTSTPVIVPMAVGFIVEAISSYLGYQIMPPEIPE